MVHTRMYHIQTCTYKDVHVNTCMPYLVYTRTCMYIHVCMSCMYSFQNITIFWQHPTCKEVLEHCNVHHPSIVIQITIYSLTCIQVWAVYTFEIHLCTLFNTTLYFQSGPISLALPQNLSPTQAPLLQSCLLLPSSLTRIHSLSTQALLATSKLPHPRVYLVHCSVVATPAILCSCVTAAHWEARILVLDVLVKNDWVWVISQEQGDQRNSAHNVNCWSHVKAWRWGWLI